MKDQAIFQIFKKNYAQIFFSVVGLIFLSFCFYLLWQEKLAGASATFAMAFLSFIWSNLARFKRFKGLGFEAELWEDKKREAQKLIEQLKVIIDIYTREIVMGKVRAGRFGSGNRWSDCWKVYNDILQQNSEMGLDIDFSDLKKDMETYFVFDMVSKQYQPVWKVINDGLNSAREIIREEFGSPITDLEGHNKRNQQLREINPEIKDLFKVAQDSDLAAQILDWVKDSRCKLKEYFDVDLEFPEDNLNNLNKISSLYQSDQIGGTEELIELTETN